MNYYLSLLSCVFVMSGFTTSTPKPVSLKINPAYSKVEWFAKKVTGAHNGTLNVKSGTLDFKNNDLVAGKIEMDMTTLSVSDIQGEWGQKLAVHLKGVDFFNVEKFNTALLNLKKAELLLSGAYKVIADITIKGITKEIMFEAMINRDLGTASAELNLDRTDFDIKYSSSKFFPEIGNKMIYDEFNLKINLSFAKAL
ncbi:MAG: YceI family protein [Saprospiraceae bacterium]